jgi:hypothetical protein
VVLTDVALAGKRDVELVIEARGFVTPSQPTQRVRVRVNTADVGELWLGWDITLTSLPVPAEALKSSLLQIDLVPESPISPVTTGTSSDQRLLGIGLKSLQFRELKQEENYALQGLLADGWMMRDASLQIKRSEPDKQLLMQIEVPAELPFRFPLNIKAKLEEHELQSLDVAKPGQYDMVIPLDRTGRVELQADQWLVPARLGIGSSDERELSYRLVKLEDKKLDGHELRSLDFPIPGRCEMAIPQAQVLIINPSPMIVPEESSLERIPPRPQEERQAGYDLAFDRKTLFYDAFWVGSQLMLVGPPLRNLRSATEAASVFVDDKSAGAPAQFIDLDRASRSILECDGTGQSITFKFPDLTIRTGIGADCAELFEDRRAIVTMSKNNNLKWIEDWLTYHVRIHNADAILLYDNNSDAYDLDALRDTLSRVQGIKVAVIVVWNYLRGPPGGPSTIWDSDYCQYGGLEHARWRFLRRARSVLNCDIDELVLSTDDRTVFEHAESHEAGVVGFHGRWIENIKLDAEVTGHQEQRHAMFAYYVADAPRCPTKWCAVPTAIADHRQWLVHEISGSPFADDKALLYRHFKGISTHWKYSREIEIHGTYKRAECSRDESIHKMDFELLEAVRRAGIGPGQETPR